VKKAPLILLFLLFIYLPGHGVAAASDLVLYYENKEIKMFFDKENIATTENIKRVWIEVKYEPPVKIGNAPVYTSSVLGLLEIRGRLDTSITVQHIHHLINPRYSCINNFRLITI
jgi:hypothetical protein